MSQQPPAPASADAKNVKGIKILIIGAGIAGLAAAIGCARAGHEVELVEAAKKLEEIGAGLQVTPNAARILYNWGLGPSLEHAGCEPSTLSVHRYADGSVLAHEPEFNTDVRQKYSAPFIDIHRGDLHAMLHQTALDLGVQVHTGTRITSIDLDKNTASTETSQEDGDSTSNSLRCFSADLIVGADGLWSRCREVLVGHADPPLPTGDLAFRIVLDSEVLPSDLKEWVESPACRFWIGPDSHVVAYSIRSGKVYNIVLLVPDDLPGDVARQEASVEEMRELFKKWDPVLARFLQHVNKVDKWKLMHRAELERWATDDGTFTLIGDACHPMLPYLAQGANSAVEDGATLGLMLAGVTKKSDLKARVGAWVRMRKARGEAIAKETFRQRHQFHMPDGPEQIERDKIFKSQLGKTVSVKFPSSWSCPDVQPWLWGYDAEKEAKIQLNQLEVGKKVEAS